MTVPSLLGVHCSISGGYLNALEEAKRLGIDTMQIFTKNQRQWKEKIVTSSEADSFKVTMKNYGIKTAFSHASYLINLGTQEEELKKKSILAMAGEIIRCYSLGLAYTVLHPGSCKDAPEARTIEHIAENLSIILEHTANHPATILLENTAGQGNAMGYTMEQLGRILKLVNSVRLGICIDTCHAFVAGYDIRSEKGLRILFDEIEKEIGFDKLKAFHLNDSKGKLGSKLDRHHHVGMGELGLVPFRYIIKNFNYIPKVLETDKEGEMDEKNLLKLRSLID